MINDDDVLERDQIFMLKINASSLPPNMVTLATNNEATVFILNDDSKLYTLIDFKTSGISIQHFGAVPDVISSYNSKWIENGKKLQSS